MIKKTLKNALWVPLGVTFGRTLPRFMSPHLYNETWPPVWKEAAMFFSVSYVVAFLMLLLCEGISAKVNKRVLDDK